MTRRAVLCCLSMASFSACGRRRVEVPAAVNQSRAASTNDYIDLQPGWRIRVTTPLLRGGATQDPIAAEERSGNTIVLKAGEQLEGYETCFYNVEERRTGGVRIQFSGAEVTKEGRTTAQSRPRGKPLFNVPRKRRFVRLIYLTRLSQSDHDMAVAAAESMQALETLTAAVLRNPAACHTGCWWIPAGVAAVPEMQRGGSWSPVR